MAERFVTVDRSTPMLLPPDLRDWVAPDDLVHLVIEAVDQLPASSFKINWRGSGSAQYPPRMMLALLIYGYAHGIFSSRRLEAATYRDVAVRYLTADTHPDHDTIAAFRRENFELIVESFVRVLELAKELKLLKLGNVSIDGSLLKANASKRRSISYQRAGELVEELEAEVRELLKQAEAADQSEQSASKLPEAISRRQELKAQLEQARQRLEQRARQRAEAERAEFERKQQSYERRKGRGSPPRVPSSTPRPTEQINLTDADSRLMRKSQRESFQQAYNAQLAVDADGSQLILGAYVTSNGADNNELLPMSGLLKERLKEAPTAVLADKGYINASAFETLQDQGTAAYVALQAEALNCQRRYDFRPREARSENPRKHTDPRLVEMAEKLQTKEGRALYAKRKQSVEPVFGILKSVLKFDRFSTRGLAQVNLEWNLLAVAYNLKRLHKLKAQAKPKPPNPSNDTPAQRAPALGAAKKLLFGRSWLAKVLAKFITIPKSVFIFRGYAFPLPEAEPKKPV